MPVKCICNDYALTYRQILALAPTEGTLKEYFICPKCQLKLQVVFASNIKLLIVELLFLLVGMIVAIKLFWGVDRVVLMAIVALIFLAIPYLTIWPFLIELERWQPEKVWLPESRLHGYSVYLLLPVLGIFAFIMVIDIFGLFY